MRLFRRLSYLVLILCIMPATAGLATDQPLTLEDLERFAEETRELKLQYPPPIRVLSKEEYRAEILAEVDSEEWDESFADTTLYCIFLGLLAPDQDYKTEYINYYSGAMAGVYDPLTEGITILDADPDSLDTWGVIEWVVMVHEIAHAIQYQNFPVRNFENNEIWWTSNGEDALSAMVEGEATMVHIFYLYDNDLLDAYEAEVEEQLATGGYDDLEDSPYFLTATTYFTHTEGYYFVYFLWMDGGWDAVNEAWKNPPTTTEQILHPAKYIRGEEAIPVSLIDPTTTMGDDWQILSDDELGEFALRTLLFNNGASWEDATTVARGWGGDHMYMVRNGDEIAMVMKTVWDTEPDAEEFFETWVQTESLRLGANPVVLEDGSIELISAGWHGLVEHNGDEVTYYLAQSDTAFILIVESQFVSEPVQSN